MDLGKFFKDQGKNVGNIVRKVKGEGKHIEAGFMKDDEIVPAPTKKEGLKRFGEWSMIKMGLGPSLEDYEYDENVGNLEDEYVVRYRETRRALQALQKESDAELALRRRLWAARAAGALWRPPPPPPAAAAAAPAPAATEGGVAAPAGAAAGGELDAALAAALADREAHEVLEAFLGELVENALAAAWGLTKALDAERKARRDLVIDYQVAAREYQEALDEAGWHYVDQEQARRRAKKRRAALVAAIKRVRGVTLDLKRKLGAFEAVQAPLRRHLRRALAAAALWEARRLRARLLLSRAPPAAGAAAGGGGGDEGMDGLNDNFAEDAVVGIPELFRQLQMLESSINIPTSSGKGMLKGADVVEQLMVEQLSKIQIPTWVCPKCTVQNELSKEKCSACGTSQQAALGSGGAPAPAAGPAGEGDGGGGGGPSAGAEEGGEQGAAAWTWACGDCTLENGLGREACAACGAAMPVAEPGAAAAAGEEGEGEEEPPPPPTHPPPPPCPRDAPGVNVEFLRACVSYLEAPSSPGHPSQLKAPGLFTRKLQHDLAPEEYTDVQTLIQQANNHDGTDTPEYTIPAGTEPNLVVAAIAYFFRDSSFPAAFSQDQLNCLAVSARKLNSVGGSGEGSIFEKEELQALFAKNVQECIQVMAEVARDALFLVLWLAVMEGATAGGREEGLATGDEAAATAGGCLAFWLGCSWAKEEQNISEEKKLEHMSDLNLVCESLVKMAKSIRPVADALMRGEGNGITHQNFQFHFAAALQQQQQQQAPADERRQSQEEENQCNVIPCSTSSNNGITSNGNQEGVEGEKI